MRVKHAGGTKERTLRRSRSELISGRAVGWRVCRTEETMVAWFSLYV
jgi:hypothetical protein